jgi:transcriptional regulator with PAS, ATPase and Fis domain
MIFCCLMHHFLDYYSGRLSKKFSGFNDDAREALLSYPWPGNVRELENAVEYAVNIEAESRITRASLPEKITRFMNSSDPVGLEDLNVLEEKAIKAALQKYGYTTCGKSRPLLLLALAELRSIGS